MPELPDVTVYIEALTPRLVGKTIAKVRVASPFVVRTFDPPVKWVEGREVRGLRRVGKRIVMGFDEGVFLAIHLMRAGRFQWKPPNAKVPGKLGLAAFDVAEGTLILTEAGTKKRASIHLVRGEAALAALDRGGIDPMTCSLADFTRVLRSERHTLKRSLTDPRLYSGIGNAYSDEILHAAKLSPVTMSDRLTDADVARLHRAIVDTMNLWIDRLRAEAGAGFPEKVTAFREDMAVHGRFKQPCPVCGDPVQRIVYAESETNYCPTCQTGGKLLADRGLSRLLREDWPRSLDELDDYIAERKVEVERKPAK
jgi:formamidopyrimidine-DNA glycosylase